jgi:hypothetical protein
MDRRDHSKIVGSKKKVAGRVMLALTLALAMVFVFTPPSYSSIPGWSDPQNLSPASTDNYSVQIAVDSGGNPHAVWVGDDGTGTDSPKNIWYFAEGTTRDNFDMWLAVQNANSQDARVKLHFLKSDGTEQVENYTVGSNSRWTFNASIPLGIGIDSAVFVESNLPVVVERMMYFSYGPGWKGGHAVMGASWTGGHDVAGYIP